MANGSFAVYRNNLWTPQAGFAAIDLVAGTVRAFFVDYADDTPVLATDQDVADILAAARVPAWASAVALGTKAVGSIGAGIFSAANTTFPTLAGDQSEALLIAHDAGTEATSMLLYLWDAISGIPLVPNGGNVVSAWNAAGVFAQQ